MSDIKSRILTRKVLLRYLYEKLFVFGTEIESQNNTIIGDLRNIFFEDIEYIYDNFFYIDEQDKIKIDTDYLKKMSDNIFLYYQKVKTEVDNNTSTFDFNKMDIMDKALFVLGYTEFKDIGSDKKLVINEMIELGKRYGDEGSPRLINAILHKILD